MAMLIQFTQHSLLYTAADFAEKESCCKLQDQIYTSECQYNKDISTNLQSTFSKQQPIVREIEILTPNKKISFTQSFNANLVQPQHSLLHTAAGCRYVSELTILRWNAISLQKETLFKIQRMREGRGAGGLQCH